MHPNKPPLPLESLVVYLYVEELVWLSYSELTVMVTGDDAHTLLAASSPLPSASTPDTLGSLGSESITCPLHRYLHLAR